MWRLTWDVVVLEGCGDSSQMWWLFRDVVTHVKCGGSCGVWWLQLLIWDAVAHVGCSSS